MELSKGKVGELAISPIFTFSPIVKNKFTMQLTLADFITNKRFSLRGNLRIEGKNRGQKPVYQVIAFRISNATNFPSIEKYCIKCTNKIPLVYLKLMIHLVVAIGVISERLSKQKMHVFLLNL